MYRVVQENLYTFITIHWYKSVQIFLSHPVLPGIFKVAKHTFTKISNIQKCPQRRQSMLKIEKLMQFYRKCIWNIFNMSAHIL